MKNLILGFCLAAALAAQAAEVVATKFATHDIVIAERVLEPAIGAVDFAPQLQKAVDEVARLGGGVVFLRAGAYWFATPVTVRRGVTIRGDYASGKPTNGTILEIVGGRGEEEGPAAFSLENGSGLVGLAFHYPDQKFDEPVAYPWTVRTALEGRAGNNQTVMDCTFINSWQALRVGPESNECHTFRRLAICALKTGFLIDMTTDIGRITEVAVNPAVWAKSGFPGSPSLDSLSDWLKSSGATGAVYRRSDWEFIRALTISGYATGIRFEKAKVPTNAVVADSHISDCAVALRLDDLNWVGLACSLSSFNGTEATVRCADDFRSTVLFNSCQFAGGPISVSKKGRLSFSNCRVMTTIDDSSGGCIEREGDNLGPSTMERYSSFKVDFPDFAAMRVVFAADFGVSREAEDNTAALQKALDMAARKRGKATVYLGAGYYRFSGNIKVPSGVELRGSSDVPHHTQNGGTVLLATAGRGDENGEPFIALAQGSGLRGLAVWYPEQPISEPVAYPWTIRSMGPRCWLRDVNLGNSWQGVDFATNLSDGHVISYVSGGFFKTGVLVGNTTSRGWVEDLQFNPHYMLRLPPRLPVTWGPRKPDVHGEHPAYPFCRKHLRGIVLRDCADEKVVGTFLYAARDGLSIEGKTKADVLIHGTDTGCRGIRLALNHGSVATVALAQLVPIGADEEGAIVADAFNMGKAFFTATQIWPKNPVLVNNGTGKILLDQYNACGGGGVTGRAEGVTVLLGHVSR